MRLPFRRARPSAPTPAAAPPPGPGGGTPPPPPAPEDVVLAYHATTKHHPHRHARSLGYLDWDTQPDPFRRFPGAPVLELPFPSGDDTPPFDVLAATGGGGAAAVAARPVGFERVAQLFELALGLSAWKRVPGTEWSLRVNPSSGNLHPTEGYLVAGPLAGAPDGSALATDATVCHYAPREHALEVRARLDAAAWSAALEGALPDGAFLVGLTSIHWREAWKYGERAYRYCQHDVGHALAALRYSAAALGWGLVVLAAASDDDVAAVLGIDRVDDFPIAPEREHPDLLAVVLPRGARAPGPLAPPTALVRAVRAASWTGRAAPLSPDHVEWDVIDLVASAARKPATTEVAAWAAAPAAGAGDVAAPVPAAAGAASGRPSARTLVLQRRSAVDLDGETAVPVEVFFRMLARTLPTCAPTGAAPQPPFDALPWRPQVHLALFVHRVAGLPRGLYLLARDPDPAVRDALRAGTKPSFAFEAPAAAGCPAWLPLDLLEAGDFRGTAAAVSCTQAIAGDSAFSLGMIAALEPAIRTAGAFGYRRLHWEAGVVGQVLYLEAEAAGVRGTGIGCFYDDAVHDVFGLGRGPFRTLYHFTVGGPVDDPRLTTLPPYPDEVRRARTR